jgi:hypothetical protein
VAAVSLSVVVAGAVALLILAVVGTVAIVLDNMSPPVGKVVPVSLLTVVDVLSIVSPPDVCTVWCKIVWLDDH